MANIPKVTLNNGHQIPIIGLGTWQLTPAEVGKVVKNAIDVGYRHIDCAFIYGNEKEIGAAIIEKISESIIKREDLFITSKLWNTFHRPEAVEPALRKTLEDLQLDYLDLYLIHCPFGYKEGKELIPVGPNGVEFSDDDYIDTWKAMEEIYKKGLVKSIGISNFNSKQIVRLLENANVVPACNQIECHPYLNQNKLMEFCKSRGIQITAYSSLGAPYNAFDQPNDPIPLADTKLQQIAEMYKKTPAQIALKFQVQRGNITVPKSVKKERLIKNLDIFDFELASNEIAFMESLGCNFRVWLKDEIKAHKYYPFGFVE